MFWRSKKHFTIIVVPHSERTVLTVRLHLASVQLLGFLVVALVISLLVFTNAYQQMKAQLVELHELRTINREQKHQIEFLTAQTETLQDNMRRLQELDQQLREMLRLDSQPARSPSGSLPLLPEELAGTAATVAAATPRRVVSLSGQGADQTGTVSREALREAHLAKLGLEQVRAEMELRLQSLETLRAEVARQLAYLAAKPAGWPVRGVITSFYGYRASPYSGTRQFHEGLDIAARYGTPIVATGDGRVVFAGWRSAYGLTVIIDHGFGYSTFYGHNSKNAVTVGTLVRRGQIIGYVGSTGQSTGPHVHYEVWINGKPVNPWAYLREPADLVAAAGSQR